ncbi:MAG: ATP-binding protein [Microcoleaceae cyanobacterium]
MQQNNPIDEAKLKEIITQVRGNQKVTDKNPEGKYEALEKYDRDELAKSLEQLQKARLEAEAAKNYNSFKCHINHPLKVPLSNIIIPSCSDFLYKDIVAAGYDNFLANLKRINLEAVRLVEMTQNILDIIYIEAGQTLHLENIDVYRLIQCVVDRAENFTEKNRNTFKLLLEENLDTMYTDMQKVKDVLIKILDNAAKFTKDGVITLSVERVNNQKLQNLQHQGAESLNDAQNYIVFQVSDTGIGMTEEQLKDIFEPLATHSSYSGLGLGLAICQVGVR